ncbi:MAG: AbrB/MazE/SpoVT family DNA-binding domain-containing protein [Lachnospiraceae bacterium]|nr:AbrB/MazE/SpoVT family DNA-binding domain-containing protein [Lachnospiraceae bacterium]
MYSTIQKWGNSGAIRLPKVILDIAQLRENEEVQILAELDRIIINKADKARHKTLKERLANFDGEYAFEEWNTGGPVGNEVF